MCKDFYHINFYKGLCCLKEMHDNTIKYGDFVLFIQSSRKLELVNMDDAHGAGLVPAGLANAISESSVNTVYGGSVRIRDEDIPENAIAYSAGRFNIFFGGQVAVPLLFYTDKFSQQENLANLCERLSKKNE